MAKHRRCTDGTSSIPVEEQLLEQNRMKFLKGLWTSWCWALEQSRRASVEQELFGRINPETITDVDKFLRSRGLP